MLKTTSTTDRSSTRTGVGVLPWVVLAACLAASTFVAFLVRRDTDDEMRAQMALTSGELTIKIEERLQSFEVILRGGAGLFAGSEEVTRDDWRDFVATVDPQRVVPGGQGVGYAAVIAPDQLAIHTARVRAEGFPSYTVHPVGDRAVYTSVVFIEPFTDRNLRAFGYDMFSESVRRVAMEAARDTGDPALSSKVTLVQETATNVQPGALMYMPVYRHGAPVTTVADRRAAIQGWVYSPFRLADLMDSVLRSWTASVGGSLDVHLYDAAVPTNEELLYDIDGKAEPFTSSPFQQRSIVTFYGHEWLLVVDRAEGAPLIPYARMWWALIAMIAVSFLLFAVLVSVRTTRRRAGRIAQGLTTDLLARQRALEDSESRWKFALEGAGDGLWDWDLAHGSVYYSPRWKSMLGYDDDDIGSRGADWELRIHPDDAAAARALVDEVLEGRVSHVSAEFRMRCKDGSYKWILTRGMVVERAADGTPRRLIGTQKDISDQRAALERIAHLTDLYRALTDCNAAMAHATDTTSLFARICDIVVETAGLRLAWVGLVDEASGRLTPVAAAGPDTSYVDGIEISVRDDRLGRGPAGTAVRDDHPVWVQDFQHDPRVAPWLDRAAPYGWASSAALPLHRDGVAIGSLTLYSTTKEWFDDETKALLVNMADDISFALEAIHAASTLAESEHRFRSLVEQSIAGVYILDDGVLTYTNPRFNEILGHPADEVVGRTLLSFVSPDDRPHTARLLDAAWATDGRTETTFKSARNDGTTALIGITTSRATYQGRNVMMGLAQDVSDRKVAEAHIQRYATQLEHTFIQTVALATTLSEMRDPYTAGHEERVAALAVAIGVELGLPDDQLEGLRVSGFLHDVGKISVPTEILTKPVRLNSIERRLVEQHAQAGHDVLATVDFPWPVATVALQHHERLDGSGYPRGLRGDEIILEARIVSVADVVESMSSHRPYRAALGIDAALAEIEQGAGKKYDPSVVEACRRLYREKGYGRTVS